MRGTSGNLSAVLHRDPLRLAVTASGLDKGELTYHDVVVVDGDGASVPGQPRPSAVPSAEAGLHARIARVTGAGAVVHVHAMAAVLAGEFWPDGVLLKDLEMLKGIGHSAHDEQVRVPVIPNGQDMALVGADFEAAHVPGVPAVIVARHGFYAWGDDLKQARWHVEIVEWLLRFTVALHRPGAPMDF
ncbi:methylthioribulose 1-phosphate dehydratase [Jiangella endophytica]|uniref:methylthioribulose 1-phosphate dehydratase n=1 Tax=Jiangella endophytica TaxID=1623398 RepID=UPI0038CC0D3E